MMEPCYHDQSWRWPDIAVWASMHVLGDVVAEREVLEFNRTAVARMDPYRYTFEQACFVPYVKLRLQGETWFWDTAPDQDDFGRIRPRFVKQLPDGVEHLKNESLSVLDLKFKVATWDRIDSKLRVISSNAQRIKSRWWHRAFDLTCRLKPVLTSVLCETLLRDEGVDPEPAARAWIGHVARDIEAFEELERMAAHPDWNAWALKTVRMMRAAGLGRLVRQGEHESGIWLSNRDGVWPK